MIVKICGITDLEDAVAAEKLGASHLGFVFYSKSPRDVSPMLAEAIASGLTRDTKKVGLFVDEQPDTVKEIAKAVGLDVLQFHGSGNFETPEYCRQFSGYNVWKAIKVQDAASLSVIPQYTSVDAILLDAFVKDKGGGTGTTFDWRLAVEAKKSGKNIILAGGLNPSNVAEAIRKVVPYGVDVSSGVEADGDKRRKDHDKMKEFIERAMSPPVLLDIVERKKLEVKALYESHDGKGLEYYMEAAERARTHFPARNFAAAITAPGMNMIAEVKFTSPSNQKYGLPDFRTGISAVEIALEYARNGASAISVLTDWIGFKGRIEYIIQIREIFRQAGIEIPIMRKEFIIDPIQIYEGRANGADGILLIAPILSVEQMRLYISIADSLGMQCLVEAHNRYDLEKAKAAGAGLLGTNNRDLYTFNVDLGTTQRLMPYTKGWPVTAESGIKTRRDVEMMAQYGAKSILVGETLMKAQDIGAEMRELMGR
jgi:indole-3-glycerol phosphate synthase/phosphoribosylanthranilate isomerase